MRRSARSASTCSRSSIHAPSAEALAYAVTYNPKMLTRLLERNGLAGFFDAPISSDRAKTYKPDPRAHALGPALLRLPRAQIAFAAFGGWDAAGAKWFGFTTFWVNRLGVTEETLIAPDAAGADFAALARWLAAVGHSRARQ